MNSYSYNLALGFTHNNNAKPDNAKPNNGKSILLTLPKPRASDE